MCIAVISILGVLSVPRVLSASSVPSAWYRALLVLLVCPRVAHLWPMPLASPLGLPGVHQGLWSAPNDLLKLSSIHPEPLPSGIFIPADQVHLYDIDNSPSHQPSSAGYPAANGFYDYGVEDDVDVDDDVDLYEARMRRLRARKRLQELRKALMNSNNGGSSNGKAYNKIRILKTPKPQPVDNGHNSRNDGAQRSFGSSETRFDDEADDGADDKSEERRDGRQNKANTSTRTESEIETETRSTKDRAEGKEDTQSENYQRTTESPRY